MKDTKKIAVSRWLIFLSFTLAIIMEILAVLFPEVKAFNPHSIVIALFGLSICALLLTGLYFGSRGLGVPLSAGLLFKLIFSSPNRYILVPCLFFGVAVILYLELLH